MRFLSPGRLAILATVVPGQAAQAPECAGKLNPVQRDDRAPFTRGVDMSMARIPAAAAVRASFVCAAMTEAELLAELLDGLTLDGRSLLEQLDAAGHLDDGTCIYYAADVGVDFGEVVFLIGGCQ